MVERTGRRPGTGMIAALLSVALAGTLTAQAHSAWPETGGATAGAGRRHRVEAASGRAELLSAHASEHTEDRNADTSIELLFEGGTETGAPGARRSLRSLPTGEQPSLTRLIALPYCADAFVKAVLLSEPGGETAAPHDQVAAIARVDRIVRIREQTVAVVEIDPAAARRAFPGADGLSSLRLVVEPVDPTGPVCVNAGPFTRVCDRAILNYEIPRAASAPWTPPPAPLTDGSWSVRHCFSLQDCIDAEIDVLFVAGQDFVFSGSLIALAFNRASSLGLNVGIVGTSILPDVSAESLRQFLQDLYDSQSAGHFGDGHLGMVLLVGDAYAGDNQTPIVPEYDGYGGDESASDHYYACLSGDDDFEDVMIGRLPVGSGGELVAVVGKTCNYMPAAADTDWVDDVLLLGGLYYTTKDEYVQLFDEYEELIPDDCEVDRIYRHDYSSNGECRAAVVGAVNEGKLIVDYVGHGSVYTWDQVLGTTHIDQFENPATLPIVLSMTCHSGWFDNTTAPDANGSYDCLAEQLVLAPDKGAIACLAASRTSDGGSYRTLTKKFLQAAFQERCTFIGEAVGVAKLLHLQDGGSVTYARHYNLFGDPSVVFLPDSAPTELPDLVIRPHEVVLDPKYPKDRDNLTLAVPVRNLSACPLTNVLVMLDGDSDTGPYRLLANIPNLGAWSSETVEFNVPDVVLGSHTMEVRVDPRADFEESDETNNGYYKAFYTYPHAEGFPLELDAMTQTPTIARLGADRLVLATDDEGRACAIDSEGAVAWQTSPSTPPLALGPEVAPAAGDLDGDGVSEVVFTTRMGLSALDADGNPLWHEIIDDVVGSPSVVDADRDGMLDVVVATKNIFWGGSAIVAKDRDGGTLWTHSLPNGVNATTPVAIADCDLDGAPDVIYGASDGTVRALSCATTPPTELWPPVSCGQSDVTVLALADVDGDGYVEIIAGSDVATCVDAHTGSVYWSAPLGADVVCLAAGDVDSDPEPEVLIGTANGMLIFFYCGAAGFCVTLDGAPGNSAAIGDVDGDGANEILVGTDAGYLHVLKSDGTNLVSPLPVTSEGAAPTPFVADLNGDGTLEVAVGSSDEGLYFVFDFGDEGEDQAVDWAGLGAFESHRALLAQPMHGELSGDITLFGRTVVTDDLAILPDGTLTLAHGSELIFDADAGLDIQGDLVVSGLPGAEVLIRADTDDRSHLWSGIELESGASAALTSCRITGAQTAVGGSAADVTLRSCEITESGVGIYLIGCTLDAFESSVTNCDSLGVVLLSGAGTIRECSIDGNRRGGAVCSYGAQFQFDTTSFDGSLLGSGLTLGSSVVSADSCSFSGNAAHGGRVSYSSPEFTNSAFVGNGDSGIYCSVRGNPRVSWCVIEDNDVGVLTENNSAPNLGGNGSPPCEGHNSIADNATAGIVNNSGSGYTLQARYNWWGEAPPDASDFVGSVDFSSWLIDPPARLPATGVDDTSPVGFRLAQNVPNPFNPSTTVRYEVPSPGGHVEISVYDVSGRLVDTLWSGHRAPGTYEAAWNGTDSRGSRVASGIYFARMRAAEFISSRKMILLK